MALTERDRLALDELKMPAGFGAVGKLEALRRFGDPTATELSEITAAIEAAKQGAAS